MRPEHAPSMPLHLDANRSFEPELVHIPAGEFLMGSDPTQDKLAHDDEQPQHRLSLPEYDIARTPVTNAQYLAFVQATAHDPPRHWQNGRPPHDRDDHPVVWVSWHDAIVYCRWLFETTGKPYSLPSEAEWEKAARGTDGRLYPWGDEWDAARCNSDEGGRGDTTAVGAYPGGVSPYGLLDMAGNVWEWTRSLWGRGRDLEEPAFGYPYNPRDGRENLDAGEAGRVVRGGCWFYSRLFARCAYRYGNYAFDCYPYGGFRVIVLPTVPRQYRRGRLQRRA
jgi:formylglycine-generating enzyme required for sulfatase activity